MIKEIFQVLFLIYHLNQLILKLLNMLQLLNLYHLVQYLTH